MKGLIVLVGLLLATSAWAQLQSDGTFIVPVDAKLKILSPLDVQCHGGFLEFGELAVADEAVLDTQTAIGAPYNTIPLHGFSCDVTGEDSRTITLDVGSSCGDGYGSASIALSANGFTSANGIVQVYYPPSILLSASGAYTFGVHGVLTPGAGGITLPLGQSTFTPCNIVLAYQ